MQPSPAVNNPTDSKTMTTQTEAKRSYTFQWVLDAVATTEGVDSDLISPEDLDRLVREWDAFRDAVYLAEDTLGGIDEGYLRTLHPDYQGDVWAVLAWDWVLTRNHHGAGFWDGDWAEEWEEVLMTETRKVGELQVVVSDEETVCLY